MQKKTYSGGKRKIVKISAKELVDADIDYISLVGNAANRMPFRILKSENAEGNAMINLDKIFNVLKQEESVAQPKVAGYLVKTEVADQFSKYLDSKGIKILFTQALSDTGETIFKTAEVVDNAEVLGVSLNEDLKVVLIDVPAVVRKSLIEHADDSGFIPGVTDTLDRLTSSFKSLIFKEEHYGMGEEDTSEEDMSEEEKKKKKKEMDEMDMAAKVKDETAKFAEYVISLIQNIPSEAFSAQSWKPEHFVKENTSEAPVATVSVAEVSSGNEEASGEGATVGGTVSVAKEEKAQEESKETDAGLDEIKKALSDIGMTMINLSKSMDTKLSETNHAVAALGSRLESMTTDLANVKKKSEETEAVVKGTAVISSTEHDKVGAMRLSTVRGNQRVSKSEVGSAMTLLDGGFSTRTGKKVHVENY